jgi:hypothetical protein
MLPTKWGMLRTLGVVFPAEHLLPVGPLGYVTQEDGRPSTPAADTGMKNASRREWHKVAMKQVYPRYRAVTRKIACLESLARVVESRKQELGITKHDIARARNSDRRRTPEKSETLTRIQRRAREHGLKPLPAKF